jgi:hypothetical protein
VKTLEARKLLHTYSIFEVEDQVFYYTAAAFPQKRRKNSVEFSKVGTVLDSILLIFMFLALQQTLAMSKIYLRSQCR